MTATLVFTSEITSSIEEAAKHPLETAGVLLAGFATAPNGDIRLISRHIRWVPDDAYLARAANHMSIASHGYVPALSEAERIGALPIWFHTHPGAIGDPTPSMADQKVDREISDLFRLRSGAPFYAALIISPRENDLTFTGAMAPESGAAVKIDRLWRVGEGWRLTRSFDSASAEIPAIFDRSVRAFGPAIQGTLGDLRVAVVGAGGTGSAVAEQLVRLGVRHLLLFDADTLTDSNVTRVYGSTPADVGRPKVEILREYLLSIAPDLECQAVNSMITLERAARRLISCDVVFGCTDDNAGRLVLSRFATFFATPVIDAGVLLTADISGQLTGIDGRVTTLVPGAACLVCRDRVDMGRAAVELRTPEERRRLADEGYAPDLTGVEPAVVTFTTAIASAAVGELLDRLIGFGPTPAPTEVLLRWHEREISTNRVKPRSRHYCDPASQKIGKGDTRPFLEQVWPE